jgi:hypothetical protein
MMVLDAKLRDLVDTARADQFGIMDHLWGSITQLGLSLDLLDSRLWGVEQEVGNTMEVLDEHNLVNLSKGVMRALGQIPPSTFTPVNFEELQAKVSKLSNLIRAVNEDHQKADRFLMAKICSIPTHPGPIGGGLGASGGPPLSVLMCIVDNVGVEKGMLGQLLQGIQALTSKNTLLQDRLESLSHKISAQGGIVLDGLALTSESQALAAVLLECPDRDAFKVFLDVMLLCSRPSGPKPEIA